LSNYIHLFNSSTYVELWGLKPYSRRPSTGPCSAPD